MTAVFSGPPTSVGVISEYEHLEAHKTCKPIVDSISQIPLR